MMLFQIEEPSGRPDEAAGPGVAVGMDLVAGTVAVAVGGNAEILPGRDGEAALDTSSLRDEAGAFMPTPTADAILVLRDRAERTLLRPVTQAVIVAAPPLGDEVLDALGRIAAACDIVVTRVVAADRAADPAPVLAAAVAAEDDAIAARPRGPV